MKRLIEDINIILAEWDPIGINNKDIALIEYKGYIPIILKNVENEQNLIDCMEDVLINKIGVDYNHSNNEHFNDLKKICNKIILVYRLHLNGCPKLASK